MYGLVHVCVCVRALTEQIEGEVEVGISMPMKVVCLNKAKVNAEMERGWTWSLALMTFHLQCSSGYP